MNIRQVILALMVFVADPALLWGQQGKLQVTVDERIELLTTVQLLSGYEWLTKAEIGYKQDVISAFDKYHNHKAVQYYRSISGRLYGYEALLLMCHYRLPKFDKAGVFTEEDKAVLNYAHYGDTLDTFISLLKDFYKVSDFHSFFLWHKAYYARISQPIAAAAKRKDYVGHIEKHFGEKKAAYHVILSPLQMDAGFGPMIHTPKGDVLYAIVGQNYDSGPFPVFDEDALFKDLVIHEFCHSFCNPLVDAYYDQLKQDSCLLAPILKEQREQGYGTWKTCLYEHLVRANEVVLNGMIYGKETADSIYNKQLREEKWLYLEGLVPLVRNEYLPNRTKYTTEKTLMPKVMEYLDGEAKKCK